ncbi:electron transfer complex ferredoxin TmcB [Desulfovibrio ferrophilus]|uniref:4Fe-4S ferredoxin n=1 Tax=Desulfovibrio ferrophilus TaxID=241368 RepID=A0A2Z6AY41_9BACT|nr:(Fe-S)-binding protein [Desulfovibrio ferrophilus]BBD08171.1 4Fe-4S ferredoxin [Desulfovibrio ferrophilus]
MSDTAEHTEAAEPVLTFLEKVHAKAEQDQVDGKYAAFEKIEDVGIDQGVARLTPEKIQKTINGVLKGECGTRMKTYVETCVHCGLCSDACHHYLSNDKNPKYSPVGKVKRTIWNMLDKDGKLTPEECREAVIVAQTECNLCRRCQQFCPFGIDIAYMISTVRRISFKLGITPQYIQDTANSHSVTMNQMWVKDDEWPDTLQWQEDEGRDEIPRLRIPVDKEGADFMYSVIAPEPKFRTHLINQAAVIFDQAGCDWTMPQLPGWDNSDMAMFTGDFETMGRVKKMHYEVAQKLRVKKIVMGECGHAFRSVYDVGNRWLGWRMPPIEMVHSIEFFAQLFREGRIKLKDKYPEQVTFHDPCNTVRGRGLHEDGRYVANLLTQGVVEMSPSKLYNYCCNAGGGVINCGPPWKTKRVLSNKIKAEQLARMKDRGINTIVSPCHNCHGGLEDIIHHYGLEMELKFLGDLIYELMEKPGAVE